ncbi:Uncharacterized protein dnm_044750 [Desulfonema magnum]|uniref:Uncharacterized protein n=1 Tax=Desulfonema magnum TaxID=45655 RepID=A0A975BMI1_9BACT|nr:Uncharacterized protein dnm_044750 [Desulfonema magnum]
MQWISFLILDNRVTHKFLFSVAAGPAQIVMNEIQCVPMFGEPNRIHHCLCGIILLLTLQFFNDILRRTFRKKYISYFLLKDFLNRIIYHRHSVRAI